MYFILRGAKTNYRVLPVPANCQHDKKRNEPKVTIKIKLTNKQNYGKFNHYLINAIEYSLNHCSRSLHETV